MPSQFMTDSTTHFDTIIIGSGTSAYYATTGLLAGAAVGFSGVMIFELLFK